MKKKRSNSKTKRKPAKKRGRVSLKKKTRTKKIKSAFVIKKRRGEAIYDIALGNKFKTEQEIDIIVSTLDFKPLKDSNEFVKITFFEEKGKDKQAYTDLDEYSFDSLKEFKELIKERLKQMNYDFHRAPASNSPNYWKKMYRLRNYLTSIIIDIETADT